MKKKKIRRSDSKIMTKEASLLKYLRESRNLSMRQVAKMMNVSGATVNHSENGRRNLTQQNIHKFLEIYNYSYEEFQKMLDGQIMTPEHTRSECIEILKRIDSSKLRSIKAFLETF